MTHNFRWLPDSIIYLILFSLYEMQRHRHRPITLGSALYTCCDLIAFLFIQTFIPLMRFQIILTLVAIFQGGCGRKWPLKWCFLCGAQEKKRQYMKENLRRWGPSLKHGFINTGWQKRSQVPDNEEGVAIFFKAIWWQGKQKWHSADEWAEFDLAFWPLAINLTCYFIKNYGAATHIWLCIFTIPYTFFFLNTWSKKINVYVGSSREEEIWGTQKGRSCKHKEQQEDQQS